MSEVKLPSIPSISPDNLDLVAKAIKTILDVREGRLGDPLDANVTFRDLVNAGLAQLSSGGSRIPGVVVPVGSGLDGYQPVADTTIPPIPTGFSVDSAMAVIILSWNAPGYRNHAYTEIWRSSDNVLGNAILLATTDTRFYADTVGSSETYYYWIRFVSQASISGPYNDTEGTVGAGSIDPGYVLEQLSGQITESELAAALSTRIDLIDASAATAGSVNARLASEAGSRSAAIAAEATLRSAADSVLQNQIDIITAASSGDLETFINAVNAERIARELSDTTFAQADAAFSSRAADTTAALLNEVGARGQADSTINAVMAAVGATAGQAVSAIEQERTIRSSEDISIASQTTAILAAQAASAAAILAEQATRATADSAQASQSVALSANLSDTSASLKTLQNAVTTADSANASQIFNVSAGIGDVGSALKVEQLARAEADQATAGQTATFVASVATSSAALTQEQLVRAAADSASSGQVLTLQSQVGDVSAGLKVEQQTRAEADVSTSSQVTTLNSKVDIGDSANQAALVIEQATRSTADSANSGQTLSLAAALGQDTAAIKVEQDVRSGADGSLSTQVTSIAAQNGSTAAALRFEQQARADDSSAVAQSLGGLNAKVEGANSLIAQEQVVRSSQDAALASNATTLASKVDVGDAISLAAVTTEQNTRATADSSLVSQVSSLNSKLGDNTASIYAETQARIDQYASLATQSNYLGALFAGNTASITAEQNVRAAADAVSASQLSFLHSSFGTNSAAIKAEESARASQTSAISSSITTLQSSVGSNSIAIQTEQTTRATETGQLFAQYSVKIDSNGYVSGFGLSSTAVDGFPLSQFAVRANRFSIADPSVNRLQLVAAGYASLYDTWFQTATWHNFAVGDKILFSGVAGLVEATVSAMYYTYDSFTGTYFLDPTRFIVSGLVSTSITGSSYATKPLLPFVVDSGNVYIDSAFIKSAAITNAKIANLAVDDAKIASLSAVKLTTGFLSADRIAAESITATKIDSRGLTIKDSLGNIVFSSNSQISGRNLLKNAGFFQTYSPGGPTFPNLPVGWYGYMSSGSSYNNIYASVNNGGVFGTQYLIIQCVVATTAYFGAWTDSALLSNWEYGKTYTISFYARAGNSITVGKKVTAFKTSSGLTPVGQSFWSEFTTLEDPTLDYTFRRYSARVSINPNVLNLGKGLVLAVVPDVYGFQDVAIVEFCAVQVEESTVPTTWRLTDSEKVGPDNKITALNIANYMTSAAITDAYIGNTIQSYNFETGVAGWRIQKTGDIELNNAIFRGTLNVKSAASGERMEVTNSAIKVYDANGVVRVKIGNLS